MSKLYRDIIITVAKRWNTHLGKSGSRERISSGIVLVESSLHPIGFVLDMPSRH